MIHLGKRGELVARASWLRPAATTDPQLPPVEKEALLPCVTYNVSCAARADARALEEIADDESGGGGWRASWSNRPRRDCAALDRGWPGPTRTLPARTER